MNPTLPMQSSCLDLTRQMERYRVDFPILTQQVNGQRLVYLDNAATTQKPQQVIDSLVEYYSTINANIHRGVHTLSQQATEAYENARDTIRQFVGAAKSEEIIFVRGTTEGINLIAQCFGRATFKSGDEVIVSQMEHHSNIVPWQMLQNELGVVLKVIPISDSGELDLDTYRALFSPKTRLVSIVHVSNALGTVNPVKQMIDLAHQHNVPVLVDGAQAVAHLPVNVQALDCDFYVFSGHKLFGPTGIGVLYGKEKWLTAMPPYQGGGDMIKMVSFENTIFNDLPHKFEAGTPHIAGAIGLKLAVDYINAVGLSEIQAYEDNLLTYATEQALQIDGLNIIGTAKHKASVLSFTLDKIHPHDIGTILDFNGIAIRAGHHCAMPVMERFGLPATARASLAFYNTYEEVDRLFVAINKVKEIMQ